MKRINFSPKQDNACLVLKIGRKGRVKKIMRVIEIMNSLEKMEEKLKRIHSCEKIIEQLIIEAEHEAD